MNDNEIIKRTKQLMDSADKNGRIYLTQLISLDNDRPKTFARVMARHNRMSDDDDIHGGYLKRNATHMPKDEVNALNTFMTRPDVRQAYINSKTASKIIGLDKNAPTPNEEPNAPKNEADIEDLNRIQQDSPSNTGRIRNESTLSHKLGRASNQTRHQQTTVGHEDSRAREDKQKYFDSVIKRYRSMSTKGQQYLLRNLRMAKRNFHEYQVVRGFEKPTKKFETKAHNRMKDFVHGVRRSKNDSHKIYQSPVPSDEVQAVNGILDDKSHVADLKDGSTFQAIRMTNSHNLSQAKATNKALNEQAKQDVKSKKLQHHTNQGFDLYNRLSNPGQRWMSKYVSMADQDISKFNRILNNSPENGFEQNTVKRMKSMATGKTRSKNDNHVIMTSRTVPANEQKAVIDYLKNDANQTTLFKGTLDKKINPGYEQVQRLQAQKDFAKKIAKDAQGRKIHDNTAKGLKVYNSLSNSTSKRVMAKYAQMADQDIIKYKDVINNDPQNDYEKNTIQRMNGMMTGVRYSNNDEHKIITPYSVPDDDRKKMMGFLKNDDNLTALGYGSLYRQIDPNRYRKIDDGIKKDMAIRTQKQLNSHILGQQVNQGVNVYNGLSISGQRLMSKYIQMANSDYPRFQRVINSKPRGDYEKDTVQRMQDQANGIFRSSNDDHAIKTGNKIPREEQKAIKDYLVSSRSQAALFSGKLNDKLNPIEGRELDGQTKSRLSKQEKADMSNDTITMQTSDGIGVYRSLSRSGQMWMSKYVQMAEQDITKFNRVVNDKPRGSYESQTVQNMHDMAVGVRQSNNDGHVIKSPYRVPEDERKRITDYLKDPKNQTTLFSGSLNRVLNPGFNQTATGRKKSWVIKPAHVKPKEATQILKNGQDIYLNMSPSSKRLFKKELNMADNDMIEYQRVMRGGTDLTLQEQGQRERMQNMVNGVMKSNNADHHLIKVGQPIPNDEFDRMQKFFSSPKVQGMLYNGSIKRMTDTLDNGIHPNHDNEYRRQIRHLDPVQERKLNTQEQRFYHDLSPAGKKYMEAQLSFANRDLVSYDRVMYAPNNNLSVSENKMRNHFVDMQNGEARNSSGAVHIVGQPMRHSEVKAVNNYLTRSDVQATMANGSMSKAIQNQSLQELQTMESRGNDTREQMHHTAPIGGGAIAAGQKIVRSNERNYQKSMQEKSRTDTDDPDKKAKLIRLRRLREQGPTL